MDKKTLRKKVIEKLKSQSKEQREDIEAQLFRHLIHSHLWEEARTVGITVSKGFEWDTKEIIEKAWQQGKQVVVPKCKPQTKDMTFHQLTNFNQLEVVYYNLLEPDPAKTTVVKRQEIDLVIVPGLLFDKDGYRIGFGGGYYDRFLAGYSGVTVSLASKLQIINQIPYESFDIPIQYLISESGFVKDRSS